MWGAGMTPHERGQQALAEQRARRQAEAAKKKKKTGVAGTSESKPTPKPMPTTGAAGFSEHFDETAMAQYQRSK